ncbi:MAG: fluoride efflux transporter CrcB [Austwickia sp.]|nr:fluoride efflux transporter CrcB [Austwickia sp.]MBK8436269.1 fluoride efflux transporter CrcB [Austwickia sp.]MBK9101946.1 fluoride efflux transporter CrcB [Austwickia sp.]
MTVSVVMLGGALGAVTRYLVDRAVQSRHETGFPLGTLLVNLAGSLLLGGLTGAGAALAPVVHELLAVGVCGALTTYSTFSFETWRLGEQRRIGAAVLNVLATVLGCVAAAFTAYTLVSMLVSGGA